MQIFNCIINNYTLVCDDHVDNIKRGGTCICYKNCLNDGPKYFSDKCKHANKWKNCSN